MIFAQAKLIGFCYMIITSYIISNIFNVQFVFYIPGNCPITMKVFVVLCMLAAAAYGVRYEKATTKIPGSYIIKIKVGSFLIRF